jgi:hypothetical protein
MIATICRSFVEDHAKKPLKLQELLKKLKPDASDSRKGLQYPIKNHGH